jgi:hypothetical protein
MKIETGPPKEEPRFEPVTITITVEHDYELAYLWAMANCPTPTIKENLKHHPVMLSLVTKHLPTHLESQVSMDIFRAIDGLVQSREIYCDMEVD